VYCVQKVNQFIKSLSRHLALARVQECAGQFISYALFCLTKGTIPYGNICIYGELQSHFAHKDASAKNAWQNIPLLSFFTLLCYFMMLLSGLYSLAGFFQKKVYTKVPICIVQV
jgi:hypothetical protein